MNNNDLNNLKDIYNRVYNLWSFTYIFNYENQKKDKTKKEYIKEYLLLEKNINELLDKMNKIKSDLYQNWQWF